MISLCWSSVTDYGVSIMLLIWCICWSCLKVISICWGYTHTHTQHTCAVPQSALVLCSCPVEWSDLHIPFPAKSDVTPLKGLLLAGSVLSAVRSGSLRYTFMEVFPPQCQTVLPQLRFVNVCDYRYSSSKTAIIFSFFRGTRDVLQNVEVALLHTQKSRQWKVCMFLSSIIKVVFTSSEVV